MKTYTLHITEEEHALVKEMIPILGDNANIKMVVSLAIHNLHEEICLSEGKNFKKTLMSDIQEIKSMLSEVLDDGI
jgi:hypothetical protein